MVKTRQLTWKYFISVIIRIKKFRKPTQNVFWRTGSVLLSRFWVWIIVSTLPCWSSEILHFSYGNSQKSIANCWSILNDNRPTLVVINIQRENINKVTRQVKCCPAPWTRYRPTSSVYAHAAFNKDVNYRLFIGWPESYEWEWDRFSKALSDAVLRQIGCSEKLRLSRMSTVRVAESAGRPIKRCSVTTKSILSFWHFIERPESADLPGTGYYTAVNLWSAVVTPSYSYK